MRDTLMLLLKTCALCTAIVSAAAGAEFLPLSPGNMWVYRSGQSESQFTIRVGSNLLYLGSTGKTYHPLEGYATKQLYVRADEDGSLIALDLDTNTETPLTSFADSGGRWWAAPFRPCEQEGMREPDRISYNGTAGRIESAVRIQYRSFSCADSGAQFESFAENIGMLRREQGTIAGPVAYDLVDARVGSMILAEQPHAAFFLSVRPDDEEALVADLRLTSQPGTPIRLTFPTSQDFDLELRNSAGRIVWRYSDDFAFLPAKRELSVTELLFSARIPLAPNGVELSESEYMVEAWLATAGEGPQFAAAVPIRVVNRSEWRAPLRARVPR